MALRGTEYRKILLKMETVGEWSPEVNECNLESSPIGPYNGEISNWLKMENDLQNRLREANEVTIENDYVITNAAFGRGGCPNFTGKIYTVV